MNKRKYILTEKQSIKIAKDYFSGKKTMKEISIEMNMNVSIISRYINSTFESKKVDLNSCNESLISIYKSKGNKITESNKVPSIEVDNRMYSSNEDDYVSKNGRNSWRDFLEQVMR